MKNMLCFLIFLWISSSYGQQETENTFGNGLINITARDSSYSAEMGLRMQTLFTTDWSLSHAGDFGEAQPSLMIRRARLKFEGFAYSPRLRYKLQLGLSNRDMGGISDFTSDAPRFILDAVLKWKIAPHLDLWVGQTKLPGNREQLISSGSLETVDRSLVNSRFNLGRDIGIQLHHEHYLGPRFLVRESFSIAQGEGRNVTVGNLGGFQYTGRLEILPMGDFAAYKGADLQREKDPKLAVGISYDYNDDAVRAESNSGPFLYLGEDFFETDITTFFADAIFKYNGISVMAEYANRNAEHLEVFTEDGTPTGRTIFAGDGFNIQGSYLFRNNIQLVGRYTTIDLDDELSQLVEDQYTLGLSKYFVGHNLKIQTDLSYRDLNMELLDNLLYRLQVELQF